MIWSMQYGVCSMVWYGMEYAVGVDTQDSHVWSFVQELSCEVW